MKTSDMILLGAVGLTAYVLTQQQSAASAPPPQAPAPPPAAPPKLKWWQVALQVVGTVAPAVISLIAGIGAVHAKQKALLATALLNQFNETLDAGIKHNAATGKYSMAFNNKLQYLENKINELGYQVKPS